MFSSVVDVDGRPEHRKPLTAVFDLYHSYACVLNKTEPLAICFGSQNSIGNTNGKNCKTLLKLIDKTTNDNRQNDRSKIICTKYVRGLFKLQILEIFLAEGIATSLYMFGLFPKAVIRSWWFICGCIRGSHYRFLNREKKLTDFSNNFVKQATGFFLDTAQNYSSTTFTTSSDIGKLISRNFLC